MRVLLVHQPTDGGVGRHVSDLATGFADRDWEVVLCGPAPPRGLTAHFRHVRLDMRREVSPLRDLRLTIELARIVRRLRPDIVHAHSSKAGAVARAGRAANPRVPVAYSPHGYSFAGYFSQARERRVYLLAERLLGPLASRVICVCEAEARLARMVGPSRRVRVVHNGIEPPRRTCADPTVAALAREGPVICAVTLLRPGKGLETLIDAAPQLLLRHPRAQIVIAGDGADRGALESRARARQVDHAIHFLGPVSDPASVLAAADVFVHPSWAESFPYSILEAMAAGLPCVASDVGGISEAIVDGESGLLVPAADSGALATRLGDVIADPRLHERLGNAARVRAQGQFTVSAMTEQVAHVYRELA